jgi:hypothetical protein
MNEVPSISSVVVSLNRALWGEVSRSLRAVHFRVDDKTLDIFCIFDGVVSGDDEESMSCVATEVAADFPGLIVDEHCLRIDSPERVRVEPGRHIVFSRKEQA